MKAMTAQQYAEVLAFIQKCHPFAGYGKKKARIENGVKDVGTIQKYGLNIKYVDSCYDSRSAEIWSVTLRTSAKINFRSNILPLTEIFSDKPSSKDYDLEYTNMYDWIMAYLKGEWQPSKEMLKLMIVE